MGKIKFKRKRKQTQDDILDERTKESDHPLDKRDPSGCTKRKILYTKAKKKTSWEGIQRIIEDECIKKTK